MINNNYTTEDLIRFIYKETSAKESIHITEQIGADWKLKEEYQTLKEGYGKLPKVKFSPKKETLRNILAYSSTAQLEIC
ncbi:MAG: hypothetical protein ACI94Y_001297 [Maribacter sp.]|jgi:hypothetical protein